MSNVINIKPASRIRGTFVPQGDKSLSHRALILASLADGICRIENLSTGEDVRSTIRVLGELGVDIEVTSDGRSATVKGCRGSYRAPAGPLDCGNSGTTLRLVAGLLAGQPFEAVLTGDESLNRRPMKDLAEALRLMGAGVETSPEGTPPLVVRGGNLVGGTHSLKTASAQVKSAIIIAGLYARGTTVVREVLPTRDHTERLLTRLAGPQVISVDRLSRTVTVTGGMLPFQRFDLSIPGDASSAAYPIALAALLPESTLRVHYVSLNSNRVAFFRHLQLMGGNVAMKSDARESQATGGEPVGDISVRTSKLRNVPLDPERIPAMIDELPLLAIVSCLAEGGWAIRDAERLRVKETDRVSTTAAVIRGMGGVVEEHPDGLSGPGGQVFTGGVVDSFGDHRIAMIAAVAAWCAKGPSTIRDTDCVKISFPGFFDRMLELVQHS